MTNVGTWNLENLFPPGGPFGPRDQAAYEAKLDGLAALIGRSGADVLAVQEVGDPAALAELTRRLGEDWRQVASERFESGHPIRVGFLSRLPLEVVADVSAFPPPLGPVQARDDGTGISATGRGVLAARVREPGGRDLTLVSAHLKSKLLSFTGPDGRPRFTPRDEGERARVAAYALYRRTAEAVTVRALADRFIEDRGHERQVMVMGDLNDEPLAATTQILYGPPGSEIGTAGENQPDKGDRARLWNLAARIPEPERFSRVFHGRRELIDHIMVTRSLLRRALDVHTLRPGQGAGLPSVTDDPAARRDDPASDHALVFTRLADA
ncbi:MULTISPECIES: endonuclease/exonuclease/phosphatase family protein [Actinomadura]|uniref:Endonuclease/exonuclease/phosphatase family protein n=1 Tax=Actinomadura yumaensis TaxID=111807 RepID=A0ABW2CEZ6_9ACTN|nr:endonuclease/exonuclease/phosphatase family protein [Actinomadura sp. J1-007]MWK38132.1 endonuclease [Actinomadura sp. J1-007]